ncbi:MAG: calcium/proton exchanger [Gemmatimonadetes bacterium]|nr:calcium/proton exchanger [Gemmatimonadota bacterium]
MAKRLFSADRILFILLVFVPIALVADFVLHAGGLAVFVLSALAIIPLAGWMGRATEHLALHVGEGLGGLLNAAFGNAAELIIAIMALRAGLYDLVKASITGSIIGNILLVFGLAALAGGMRKSTQHFNRTAAASGVTMLVLSAIALVIPAIFHMIAGDAAPVSEHRMSLLISVVLIVTYLLSLVFALKTHSHLYSGAEESQGHSAVAGGWSVRKSMAVLLAAAAGIAVMSELLLSSVEHAGEAAGMSEVFIGVILIAIIGNAAEHSTAVVVAMKDKMDLSLNIAVGSSLQVALFVAPMLVFLSYVIGPSPMDLRFTTMEVVAVVTSVGIMAMISHDGETHWMEGVQLLAVYTILALAFFFLPV